MPAATAAGLEGGRVCCACCASRWGGREREEGWRTVAEQLQQHVVLQGGARDHVEQMAKALQPRLGPRLYLHAAAAATTCPGPVPMQTRCMSGPDLTDPSHYGGARRVGDTTWGPESCQSHATSGACPGAEAGVPGGTSTRLLAGGAGVRIDEGGRPSSDRPTRLPQGIGLDAGGSSGASRAAQGGPEQPHLGCERLGDRLGCRRGVGRARRQVADDVNAAFQICARMGSLVRQRTCTRGGGGLVQAAHARRSTGARHDMNWQPR